MGELAVPERPRGNPREEVLLHQGLQGPSSFREAQGGSCRDFEPGSLWLPQVPPLGSAKCLWHVPGHLPPALSSSGSCGLSSGLQPQTTCISGFQLDSINGEPRQRTQRWRRVRPLCLSCFSCKMWKTVTIPTAETRAEHQG